MTARTHLLKRNEVPRRRWRGPGRDPSTVEKTMNQPEDYGLAVTVETVTPRLAAKWLETNANRPLNPTYVSKWADTMATDTWFLGPPLMFDTEGRLRQGQHRLRAVIESGESIPFVVIRGIAPDAFMVLDSDLRRSVADLLAIRFPGMPNPTVIATALRFVVRYERNGVLTSTGGDMAIGLTNAEIAAALDRHRGITEAIPPRKPRILGVGMVTAFTYLAGAGEIGPEEVAAFVAVAMHGGAEDEHHPAQVLHERLRRAYRATATMDVLTNAQKAYFLVRAWNSYFAGRSIKKMQWEPSLFAKTRIAGCPIIPEKDRAVAGEGVA